MKGLELSERFFDEVIRPMIAEAFPGLAYSAGLLGSGSEVLGYDTEMSRDHNWGPRCLLFFQDDTDLSSINGLLDQGIPPDFVGFTTDIAPDRSRSHYVECYTIRGFFLDRFGIEIFRPLGPADWLVVPEQELLSIASGRLFRDDLGLEAIRQQFRHLPRDVWLYKLASGWTRIGQEEHLVGRAGYVGDEIGAQIIAARLVRDLMRLAFWYEHQLAPYPKWFGTAFSQLDCAKVLKPLLQTVLDARGWQQRDAVLIPAYEFLAGMHNDSGITDPLSAQSELFHERPFHVIESTSGFADAIRKKIVDPRVQAIASRRNIGSIDQFSDSTDLLSYPSWRPVLRNLYA
ncbi:MAG TPA: DUF4037 domain-containing protein [Fimbriimonas sp.]|nr:DUF4037 domain-containing protein [Fimbriimonas sp.]